MGLAVEIAVVFFWKNFCYTFGRKKFIQLDGGLIGARLTMAVVRIVMQFWKDKFNDVLHKSNISELLSGLYVDDGRSMQRILEYGERYCPVNKCIKIARLRRSCDSFCVHNLQETTLFAKLQLITFVCTSAIDNFFMYSNCPLFCASF